MMMKKQFFRVKQQVDQTLLRADRTEGLNHDELRKADAKVEYIYKVLLEINKRLPKGNDPPEKRKIKYFEYTLAKSFQNLSSDENGFLSNLLRECSEAEETIANEELDFETNIDSLVNAPIATILEKDLPNIFKLKKNLNKYILDKDSAKSRYQSASSKNGIQKESLKDELDEADIKVDQSRDSLAMEMFSLLTKENEITSLLLQIMKLQKTYHEGALKTLKDLTTKLEIKIGDNNIKKVFGCPLDEHLKTTNRRIAFPLELCVSALTELGMSEEGLFRIVGGASRVKRLKLSIDSGCFTLPLVDEYRDVHVLASTLKSYLRELPEPLLTFKMYDKCLELIKQPEEQRLKSIQEMLKELPEPNRDNLAYLMQFLSKLSKNPENKMSVSNIAIVISPNLLWASNNDMNNMQNCGAVNMIVELFLNNCDVLFPEDMTKYTSVKPYDIVSVENFHRPLVQCLKQNNEYHEGDTASPKPTTRKKTKQAPMPPSIKPESDNSDHEICASQYPSGSSTLNRVPKGKSVVKSVVEDKDVATHNVKEESLVNLDNSKMVDHKYMQATTNIQVTKSKPVQQVTAQLSNIEVPIMSNNVQRSAADNKPSTAAVNVPQKPSLDNIPRPVAAPRTLIPIEPVKSETKNFEETDIDVVPMRRQSKEDLVDKPNKPAIPIRPASLRTNTSKTDLDAALHKTSVYNVPHKQQPSIVNLQNRFGHDNQMAEKEKFLGHQPAPRLSLENKFSDINSNCENSKPTTIKPELPSKPPIMKSSEKLNSDSTEKMNGNPKITSHNRTRSDGNIVDLHHEAITLLQTPPSPRSLSKPSQPPPPPPTAKIKSEVETTDF